MRCLDSLGIKPQLHVFWTGADSVWWEWRPQVEWKCFPSNDLLRSKSGQCHLVIWTNCPTVEHCGHPRSDWEKHLSYRVDPLWREHNHNVKQVRLNTILLLSFPGGMMLICSSAKVLMWPGQEVRRSSQKSKKMSKGLASPSMGNVTMCQRGPIEPNSLIHMTLGHTTVIWWLSQMSRRGLVWGGWKLTPWPTTWQTLATLSLVPVCH